MAVFSGPVRRATAQAERRLREGLGLLRRLGRDLERTARPERPVPAHEARIRRLEEVLAVQDAGLVALRAELDSLVAQLNDRVLPRIDERMDDTERDLATVATALIRTGEDTAAGRTRLETLEGRVSDLRERLARVERRAGLWRDLQATMARLGDDVDALRPRVGPRVPDPAPKPAPRPAVKQAPKPVSKPMSDHTAEHVAGHAGERVGGPEART